MIHLRLFYYLGTSIFTFGIFLILVTKLGNEIKKWRNSVLLLFILFSSIHLFIFFTHLYLMYNTENLIDPQTLLIFTRIFNRIRTLAYVAFAHSLATKLKRRYNITVLIILSFGLVINVAITSIVITLYFYIFLFYLYFSRNEEDNKFRVLIKRLLILTAFTTVSFILDLFEELKIYEILSIDFYPISIILIGLFFILTYLRNKKILEITDSVNFSVLTNRENEIAVNIVQGFSNRDIAEKLYISESTVKKHINSIFKKLEIKSRWELIKIKDSPKVL